MKLYKRNSQGRPLSWSITKKISNTGEEFIEVEYGVVGGNPHRECIPITLKNANEVESRIKAKRKEGYKELSELKDSPAPIFKDNIYDTQDLIIYLNTYLPKNSTTAEGFVLPMLAKVLEDNKPFEKYGTFLGQWKINGLRCIIGAFRNTFDMFNPIQLSYHSRTGENWTVKMRWMDEIILPKLSDDLIEMMVEEGVCLDGELYLPGFTVNDINSFVKNTILPQHYMLQYWCYDICCENMSAEARRNFRFDNITHDFDNTFHIHTKEEHLNNKHQLILLQSWEVESITEAINLRNNFIELGFEGLILRNPNSEYQFGKRNQAMFKFKKIDDGIFIIADIKEDKRGLPIFVLFNDINDELFECTYNADQKTQAEFLQNKSKHFGKRVLVEFRERSGVKQVPFHSKIVKYDI